MKATIAQTTTDNPKIKPRAYGDKLGAEVTFELYDIDLNWLLNLVGKELEIEIK